LPLTARSVEDVVLSSVPCVEIKLVVTVATPPAEVWPTPAWSTKVENCVLACL